MAPAKSINQSGIQAGGHVVAGDYTHTEVYHPTIDPTPKILKELFENYGNEEHLDVEQHKIVEDLMRFTKPSTIEGGLRDLKEKLSEGDRDNFLKAGLELKDSFRRNIERYQHSPSAQKIFAYLLAAIRTEFDGRIFHDISNYSNAELSDAILTKVIEPTLAQIPSSKPLITKDTLLGMLYFLTGNCFLEWS